MKPFDTPGRIAAIDRPGSGPPLMVSITSRNGVPIMNSATPGAVARCR